MGSGNIFDWDRQHPVEPPRLNDPPEADRVCGDCAWYDKCGSVTGECGKPDGDGEAQFADDEACEEFEEGEE